MSTGHQTRVYTAPVVVFIFTEMMSSLRIWYAGSELIPCVIHVDTESMCIVTKAWIGYYRRMFVITVEQIYTLLCLSIYTQITLRFCEMGMSVC